MNTLQNRIVALLAKHDKPMNMPVIEAYLTIEDNRRIDTFDVRDAIRALEESKLIKRNIFYEFELTGWEI